MNYRISLGKKGAKNLAPIFSQFTAKQLKISSSTYSRYKKKLSQGKELPEKITAKLLKHPSAKSSIKFSNNSKWDFKVPQSTIKEIESKKFTYKKKFKLDKKSKKFKVVGTKKTKIKYVWVKFQLYKNTTFFKSALLPIDKANKLNSFISAYVDSEIRQYGDEPIYITGISLETI